MHIRSLLGTAIYNIDLHEFTHIVIVSIVFSFFHQFFIKQGIQIKYLCALPKYFNRKCHCHKPL